MKQVDRIQDAGKKVLVGAILWFLTVMCTVGVVALVWYHPKILLVPIFVLVGGVFIEVCHATGEYFLD